MYRHLRGIMSSEEEIAVIFLAAGYGTRIAKALDADPQFSHLSSTPKPLLPIVGLPLLSHWLPEVSALSNLACVTVITNAFYFEQYEVWANSPSTKALIKAPITVLNDDTQNNVTRLGAVQDLQLAISHVQRTAKQATLAVVVAADTLLPGVDFAKDVVVPFLSTTSTRFPLGVVSYRLADMTDCSRRGMLSVREEENDVLVATGLVEKPKAPELAPSPWATAPIYLFRKSMWPSVSEFLNARANDPLEKRDAPGHFLAWLLGSHHYPCMIRPVPQRVDIGNLSHYVDALWMYSTSVMKTSKSNTGVSRACNEPAVGRAFPRLGLLGNPSDMYGIGGRVIGVAIESEGYAEVIASPSSDFKILDNPKMELPVSFTKLSKFVETVREKGPKFGARQIIVAMASAFLRKAIESKVIPADATCCTLSYSTTIPARVGLAGSSALGLATWYALARFYRTTFEQIDPDRTTWPVLLRSVEALDLGIACGLMDRISQVMRGCVDMDFTNGEPGKWTHIPFENLPQLYVAYHRDPVAADAAQCSGDVHSRAKKRLRSMYDPDVKRIITDLAQGAKTFSDALCEVDTDKRTLALEHLPDLFDRNFELRCELLGVSNVGSANTKLVDTLKSKGFAAKMSGSGGCAVCVPRPLKALSQQEESDVTEKLANHDILFRRVKVLEPIEWAA